MIAAGYSHGFGSNLTVFTGVATADTAQHALDNWIKSPGHFQAGHQSLADWQLRRAVCHAGLVDKLNQFLPHVQIFRLAFGVRAGRGSRVSGGADCERQGPALSGTPATSRP